MENQCVREGERGRERERERGRTERQREQSESERKGSRVRGPGRRRSEWSTLITSAVFVSPRWTRDAGSLCLSDAEGVDGDGERTQRLCTALHLDTRAALTEVCEEATGWTGGPQGATSVNVLGCQQNHLASRER